jgi:hypothetical protein
LNDYGDGDITEGILDVLLHDHTEAASVGHQLEHFEDGE